MNKSSAFETKFVSLRFDLTPQEVENTASAALAEAEKAIESIAALPVKERSFKSTHLALEAALGRLDDALSPLNLLKETSPSTQVQEAAKKVADLSSAFFAKLYTRADLYQVLVSSPNAGTDAEDKKLMDETLRSFRKSGAALPEEKRKRVTALKEELSKIENEFAANLAKANDSATLSVAELEGLPQDFIDGLKTNSEGLRELTLLDASSYLPFLENARSEEARKKVVLAHDKVATTINVPLLERAIAIRDEIAKALGFSNHAALVLDSKMAKTPSRVNEFLADLQKKLLKKRDHDLAALLALKKADVPTAKAIEIWDWRYYDNQQKKKKYAVDGEIVREFFPVDHVIQTTFQIYQDLLGVSFQEMETRKKWFHEVRLFEVRDSKTDTLIGHFYLDLYPRDNKFKHFAAFDIQRARRNADGTYRTPVSAVVGNFPKPSVSGKPSLLSHQDVETFFHEFGHIMHMTLTTARYGSLSGAAVRWDFVEAPSQMLENWTWDAGMLKRLSKHYKSGQPMPDALIQSIIAARHVNEGIFWSRQLFFASVDMVFHTSGATVDTTKVWRAKSSEILGMACDPSTAPQATFSHLMGGYDAGYYGYLWSKVFAEDMFSLFSAKKLDSPSLGSQVGERYRQFILAPGGTQEPEDLIKKFLGREPSKKAFFESLGLH